MRDAVKTTNISRCFVISYYDINNSCYVHIFTYFSAVLGECRFLVFDDVHVWISYWKRLVILM